MSSGDKPWLETWRVDHDGDGSSRPRIVDQAGKYVLEGWPGAREQLALAASAPEAIREMLELEWAGADPGVDGGICVVCPSCRLLRDDGEHRNGCTLDALLTRAGLPCQRSRDAARAEIAKLAKETAR